MTDTQLEQLRFPIGHFSPPDCISAADIEGWIQSIAGFPARLRRLVTPLTDAQLDTPYRPGGWTVRQVVHHCADSHSHSMIRFKWALTEDRPLIKAYNEQHWAELLDSRQAPVSISLDYLDGLHARWAWFLRSLTADQMRTSFLHPESGMEVFTDWNIGQYAWHGEHHYAHIAELVKRKGW